MMSLPIERMRADAARVLAAYEQAGGPDTSRPDLACHVLALIEEVERLRRYERVISDYAAQIISPACTPEQLVREHLKEPWPANEPRRACR